MADNLPAVALSVLQPWAWLIAHAIKDIENRNWPTGHRGPVLIHASKGIDENAEKLLRVGQHPAYPQHWARRPPLDLRGHTLPATFDRGGIVGVATITDCVVYGQYDSDWLKGPYGFVLEDARPLPFMPLRGQLSFFKATYRNPAEQDQSCT